jgi:hypothetical protein
MNTDMVTVDAIRELKAREEQERQIVAAVALAMIGVRS